MAVVAASFQIPAWDAPDDVLEELVALHVERAEAEKEAEMRRRLGLKGA